MRHTDLMLLSKARHDLKSGAARTLRLEVGLTQREIAEQVGVSPVAISRWEAGERVPRGAAAVRYARLLAALAKRPAA